jgi:Protein of unknown function (DUF1553)/Protein of unknown function (DUF1549)/Concanavalin A-like lectin/glucanases superfamily/Planctomycete cytochrome C
MRRVSSVVFVLLLALSLNGGARSADGPPLRFSRDVLPILSENCFQCHGPDEKARKGKLRLDDRAGVASVVTAGKSGASELIRRINAEPGDGRMPPAKANRKLSVGQKELLRRWVDEGATWGKHWAYETPDRVAPPTVKHASRVRNPIDRFVFARLEREGLAPAPEAARPALIRRVSLDLTGLPPTLEEIDAFLADHSPDAYEKVVERLLASPRYGERMAMDWLDAARYADTNGYQNDFARTMWPWRDWVIGAFNENYPFDRFIVEQLAGDLLPEATRDQKIATGFNRNNRTVTEAGSIDEEWRIENAVDRVETTATVFLGLTLGCCRCHDHKYDPISQREFYEFLAFFNSVNEKGVYTEQRGNVAPFLDVPSREQEERLRDLKAAADRADSTVGVETTLLPEHQRRWEMERFATPLPADLADRAFHCSLDGNLGMAAVCDDESHAQYHGKDAPAWVDGVYGKALRLDGKDDSYVEAGPGATFAHTDHFSYGAFIRPRGDGACLSKMDDAAAFRGFDLLVSGGKATVHLVHSFPDNALKVAMKAALPKDEWAHVFVTYDGSGKAAGVKIYLDGRPAETEILNDKLQNTIETGEPLRLGKRSASAAFSGDLADVRIYSRTLTEGEVGVLAAMPFEHIVRTPEAKRSPQEKATLARAYSERFADRLRVAKESTAKARKELNEFKRQIPTVMVMEDRGSPRPTFVLKRGRYDMPDKEQKVAPDVPGCMPALGQDVPRNRLGLARWLVSPDNPLTARVAVNRFWQHYFGIGLVKTAENFGVQGEAPSHLELLDWLATEFVRTGWDVKAMQRLIVTSATYRQSSHAAPGLVQRDPENRLLARGPRMRLSAEVVRDNALLIGGLLVEKIGGHSVKPYQPEGLWEELAGGAGEEPYKQDKGPDLYRRSLYVYRKRTVPHPLLATFDAPAREICQVRLARTNTPLQALELLNDVTYVEAARGLAQIMLTRGGAAAEERIAYGFRRATARPPDCAELKVLLRSFERYRQNYAVDRQAAEHLIHHGDSPPSDKLDPAELAAYTAAAGVILNLDETITKE